MTGKEIIEVLESHYHTMSMGYCNSADCRRHNDAIKKAIEAVEKQIPKEIDFEMNFGDCESRFACKCGKKIPVRHDRGVMSNHNAPNYCPNCGQCLNWGDSD